MGTDTISRSVRQEKITKETQWEEIPENIKAWFGNERQKRDAAFGKNFPPEFLYEMANIALQFVYEWGKDNNAPDEILDLLSGGHVLMNYCVWLKGKELQPFAYADIPDTILEIIISANRLGKNILTDGM